MSRYKQLLDNETLGDGLATERFYVAGMESIDVLLGNVTYNGMVFEVWYVIDTEDGEVELVGYYPDPTSNTWRKWQISSVYSACSGIPVMGATWMYLKNSGGADIDAATVWVTAKEETS